MAWQCRRAIRSIGSTWVASGDEAAGAAGFFRTVSVQFAVDRRPERDHFGRGVPSSTRASLQHDDLVGVSHGAEAVAIMITVRPSSSLRAPHDEALGFGVSARRSARRRIMIGLLRITARAIRCADAGARERVARPSPPSSRTMRIL